MQTHRSARAAFLLALGLAVVFASPTRAAERIRIAVFSLKNFGDIKANKPAHLKFIAERIAEQAVKGVCVVDELQDIDGSAMRKLEAEVTLRAHVSIDAAYSERVGGNTKEQFGFYWNPTLMQRVGDVQTIRFPEIERDPGVATFKCTAGFDFTLCAFHTRPSGNALRKELEFLDKLFNQVQDLDPDENDIIFVGDFNAPPTPIPTQAIAILDSMGSTTVNFRFAITSKPTNLLQNKIFDNIFFDRAQTTEFIAGPQHVVPMFDMIDDFDDPITAEDPLDWFRENVADHCPIYAIFRADRDTD